jgi:hypothetical protein
MDGTLIPVGGKIYKSRTLVLKEWNEGKDFIFYGPKGGHSIKTNKDFDKYELLAVKYKTSKNKTNVTVMVNGMN